MGDGGRHLCNKKWGTQLPHQKNCRSGKGVHRSGNKKGGTHILQQTNILNDGLRYHFGSEKEDAVLGLSKEQGA